MWDIWIPQVAAFLSAFVVSYFAKRGFTLEAEATTAIFVAIFATVKTVVGARLNPGNVNAKELVEEPKEARQQVRAAARARKTSGGF